MRKLNLKEGDVFNRLTLLKMTVLKTKNGTKGLWRCICGNELLIVNSKVVSGHSKSCSCFQKEIIRNLNLKHNCANKNNESNEYICWQNMKDRCLNKNNKDYKHYGERGITVCKEWRNSFETFIKDMGKKPSKEYSIERIDNDNNYCKENCKWIPKKNQLINRRNSIMVIYNNKDYCLKHACILLNIKYYLILSNFKKYKILPEKLILITN